MAIDKLHKVTVFVPARDARWFLSRLYQLRLVHIVDIFPQIKNSSLPYVKRPPSSIEEVEKIIFKISSTLSILDKFVQKKKGFVEGIFPFPVQTTWSELDQTLSQFNIESIYKENHDKYEKYLALQKKRTQLKEQMEYLKDFLPLSDTLTLIKDIKSVCFFYCRIPESLYNKVIKSTLARKFIDWQVILQTEREFKVLFVYLPTEKPAALEIFAKYNLKEIPFPALQENVKESMDKLLTEITNLDQELNLIRNRFIELSNKRRSMDILLGYWENERDKIIAQRNCALSKRVFMLLGYIKAKDKFKLDMLLRDEFPQASILYEEPSLGDKVPVSLTVNRFFMPAQLLVNMFGLPDYFTFDPTGFIMVSFLLLFGLCFGDVFYGMCLVVLSAWVAKRYKESEFLYNFSKLFLYAGISTMICGAITGGWAGDLYNPKYLGENNLLVKLKETFSLIDPLSKPVIALFSCILLGVINQLYGIILNMYAELRRRNIAGAICDGLLWLIMLPGFLILALSIFIELPTLIIYIGKYMAIAGSLGLVFTQGRGRKGIATKIITGIISLYGIVGTYGCISFIGDILSYTRILALSLTTTIVGMSFNLVAGLFLNNDLLGIMLFTFIAFLGHSLNFFISILSAFVHPARLIFLEFFNRFYKGGAPEFHPYGFGNKRIIVKENQ